MDLNRLYILSNRDEYYYYCLLLHVPSFKLFNTYETVVISPWNMLEGFKSKGVGEQTQMIPVSFHILGRHVYKPRGGGGRAFLGAEDMGCF